MAATRHSNQETRTSVRRAFTKQSSSCRVSCPAFAGGGRVVTIGPHRGVRGSPPHFSCAITVVVDGESKQTQ